MGTPHSHIELIDFAPNRNYYQGRRFTQIPKELYPNMYKRGWLYGWYETKT